ncbi:AhpC/TSA family protein [Halosquirtibacter xylanolyticus]|uniref:peroxiredoxin-like family protein n=1 Tax=Halosquirtibacter xylanolyticus TaxID=3374599 RepID=UPI003748E65A|nr:AhpC/TSA family protein [Prolixibacteraceae bacterium]
MKYLIVLFLFMAQLTSAQLPKDPKDISPLLIGENIPKVSVKKVDGTDIPMKDVLNSKKSVLVFYRGGWCPYCNLHLSELQKAESEILELGYQIVAISPDSPKNLQKTEEKDEIKYQLFSDANGELIKAMGIGFKAPFKYNLMLKSKSGGENEDSLLPVPSVFVVDENGTILFEYIDPDYKTRLSSKLLLAVLKNI